MNLISHYQKRDTTIFDYQMQVSMLQQSTIKFLTDLKKNNNKEWFDKNRKVYEAAKADFLNLTTAVLENLSKKDTTISHLDPKKCVFRINRDIRFSKDKSPYKTNMGMSIGKAGKVAICAGYYFHVEPGQCFIGGGIYMPMPDEVKKIRQEIDYGFTEFKKIIAAKKFVTAFGKVNTSAEYSLSRPPKGYDESNPAIEFIKLKSWIVGTPVADADLADKNLAKKIVEKFETMKPFIDFLNKAVES